VDSAEGGKVLGFSMISEEEEEDFSEGGVMEMSSRYIFSTSF
jgi:hypothetical protein